MLGNLDDNEDNENVGVNVGAIDEMRVGDTEGDIVGPNVEIGTKVGINVGFVVDVTGVSKTKLAEGINMPPLLQTTQTFTLPVDGITIATVSELPLLEGKTLFFGEQFV